MHREEDALPYFRAMRDCIEAVPFKLFGLSMLENLLIFFTNLYGNRNDVARKKKRSQRRFFSSFLFMHKKWGANTVAVISIVF